MKIQIPDFPVPECKLYADDEKHLIKFCKVPPQS